MKKILLIFAFLISTFAIGQVKTTTVNNKLKLKNTPNLTVTDSLVTKDSNQILRSTAFTDFKTQLNLGSFLENIVEDLTPQLGANLGLNGFDITGIGNINHTGNITSTGTSQSLNSIITNNVTFSNYPNVRVDADAVNFLHTDINGNLLSSPVTALDQNLQEVTDSGATTTNFITIDNGTAGNLNLGTSVTLSGNSAANSLLINAGSNFQMIMDSEDGLSINTVSQGSAINRVVLTTDLITSTRALQFPDQSGIIALNTDIAITPLDEGNGIGFVRNGRDATKFGNVGLRAFDFSVNEAAYIPSTTRGATGEASVIFGDDNIGSGFGAFGNGFELNLSNTYSTGFGRGLIVSGDSSFSTGIDNIVSGFDSFATGAGNNVSGSYASGIGIGLISKNPGSVWVGQSNLDYFPTGGINQSDHIMFGVGNGTILAGTPNTRGVGSDALNVFFDGTITAPSLSIAKINTAGNPSLITKEYGDANYAFDTDVVHLTGTETITGQKTFNAKLSATDVFEVGSGHTITGANATALGVGHIVSDLRAFATGTGNTASGSNSFAGGSGSVSEGSSSFSYGPTNFAKSLGEASVGRFGTDYTSLGDDTDRVFNVGNGNNIASPSDAFTIFKSGDAILNGDFTSTGNIISQGTGNSSFVGNVGIGIASPATKFHVLNTGGSAIIRSESNVGNIFDFTASSTGNSFIVASDGSDIFLGHTADVNQITIKDGGNVGIGTTTPNHKLEVAGGVGLQITVSIKTSNYNVTTSDSNTFFTNEGAGGTVTLSLPTAVAGLTYEFFVHTAQTFTIDAAAGDTIRNEATVSAVSGNISSTSVGSSIRLVAINDTEWIVTYIRRVWVIT